MEPKRGMRYPMNPSFWNSRNVLITGATGLIGSWLTKALIKKNARITALVLDCDPQSEFYRSGSYRSVSIVNGKLEDFRILEKIMVQYEIETVFHLGAQTLVHVAHHSPLLSFEPNIRGTYHLLEACRLHSKFVRRVLVASSDKAYGESAKLPYTEETPLKGKHPYEVSKSCADLIAQSYHHTYQLPVAILRCGNVYGGGDLNWSRIIPGTIRSFLHQENPVIRSDGTYLRDYIYVKDVVEAYLSLAEAMNHSKFQGEAFNFSNEKPVSVMELVKTLQGLMRARGMRYPLHPEIRNTAVGEIKNQFLSSSKAKRILKWKPRYTLQQGLAETIQWYKKYFQTNSRK